MATPELEDIARSRKELEKKGLGEFLQSETFYGMHELVGEVQLDYLQGDHNEDLALPVRIFFGRDILLPNSAKQFDYCYPNNSTWLQSLFIEGFSNLAGGGIVLSETFLSGEQLSNLYESLKSATTGNPLTLFYVHGGVMDGAMHFGPQRGEAHAVGEILNDYKHSRFSDETETPVVMLASCNVNENGWGNARIQNPGFILVYRTGVAGSVVSATGRVLYDKSHKPSTN